MPRTPFLIALALATVVTVCGCIALSVRPRASAGFPRPVRSAPLPAQPSAIVSSDGAVATAPMPAGSPWGGGRYDLRGIASVFIPRDALVDDRRADPLEFLGEARIVRITPSRTAGTAILVLQSADFGIKVADGCCEWLHGAVPLDAADAELHAVLREKFTTAWAVERFTVGGRAAVGFWSAFTYGDTRLQYHAIVGTGDAGLPILHVRSSTGVIAAPDVLLPEITDANVAVLADATSTGAGARGRVKALLDSLIFLPDQAQ